MRKILLPIVVLILGFLPTYAGVTVEKNTLKAGLFLTSASYKNTVCFLGYSNAGRFVEYFDGQRWTTIPLYYKNQHGTNDTITHNWYTGKGLAFDSTGHIWLCADRGIYQYDGTTWIKHAIDDEFADQRQYTNIVFAPNGSAYVTAEYPKLYAYQKGVKVVDRYTTMLMKFDGTSFSIIDSTEGGLSGLGTDGGFYLLKNGKLLVHLFYPGNRAYYTNNLSIYDTHNNDAKTIQTLYNPHFLRSDDKFKYSVYVNDIFEDKVGNVWFSLSGNSQTDYGAVVWKNDTTWDVVKGPMRYNSFGQDPPGDSVYYPISAIKQDINGQMWIAGAIVLNKILPDLTLQQMDKVDFFDKLMVYSTSYSPTSTYFEVDSIVKYISDISCNCLVNNYSPMHPAIISAMETTDDGSIWFAIDNLGVIRYKPLLSGVDNEAATRDEPFTLHSPGISSNDKEFTISFSTPFSMKGIALYDVGGNRVYSESSNQTDAVQYQVTFPDNISGGVYILAVLGKDRTYCRKILVR
jgi:hypothetical protein